MNYSKKIILSMGIMSGLILSSPLVGQGMKGGRHMMMDNSMQCPAMGKHYGPMMHAEDVKLEVKNLDNGVQITWTTTDKNKVQTLQNMGNHMQQRHARMQNQDTDTNSDEDKQEK